MEDELDKVADFLTTVTAVEAATGLDFGATLRDADLRAGGGEEAVVSESTIPLRGAERRQTGRPI